MYLKRNVLRLTESLAKEILLYSCSTMWVARQADDSFVCFGAKPDKGFLDLKSRRSGSGKGTRKESWLEKGAERQLVMGQQRGESAEELAWNHGQMRSTPETVVKKIGSSEEDWVEMSAFQLLVEFSLVTHASVSPHMHVELHTLLLLWVNPKHCSCLFVWFIFSCPPDRILVVPRNVHYPPPLGPLVDHRPA